MVSEAESKKFGTEKVSEPVSKKIGTEKSLGTLHFVEIYALFPQIFLAKIAIPATSHVFSMYAVRSI